MRYLKRTFLYVFIISTFVIPTYLLFSKIGWETGTKYQFKFWTFIAIIIGFIIFFAKLKKYFASLPFGFWKITTDAVTFLLSVVEIWLFFEIMENAFVGGGDTLFSIVICVLIGVISRVIDYVINSEEIIYNYYKKQLKAKYDLEKAEERYKRENNL